MDRSKCQKISSDIYNLVQEYARKNGYTTMQKNSIYDASSARVAIKFIEVEHEQGLSSFTDKDIHNGLGVPGTVVWAYWNGETGGEKGYYLATIIEIRLRIRRYVYFFSGEEEYKYSCPYAGLFIINPKTKQPSVI